MLLFYFSIDWLYCIVFICLVVFASSLCKYKKNSTGGNYRTEKSSSKTQEKPVKLNKIKSNS